MSNNVDLVKEIKNAKIALEVLTTIKNKQATPSFAEGSMNWGTNQADYMPDCSLTEDPQQPYHTLRTKMGYSKASKHRDQ